MFILYLDESGTHSDARYFVVAGIAVHESETFYLAQDLDGLQARYFPGSSDPIAFHASPLRSAFGQSHDPYIGLERARRRELSDDIFGAIVDSRPRLFAVAMEKAYTLGDCYDRGFEEIGRTESGYANGEPKLVEHPRNGPIMLRTAMCHRH